MERPDYHGGSIVNLMSTVASHFGDSVQYPYLEAFTPDLLAGVENVVLLVIDGLGYKFLNIQGKGSCLHENLRGKMTSVFPSTTAAAISSFYTGVAPQNHGIMAWYTYLRELGLVSVILRMTARATKQSFLSKSILPKDILQVQSLFDRLHATGFVVMPQGLRDSEYNQVLAGNARRVGYRDLNGFFSQISKIAKNQPGRKYIMGYWDVFDQICHKKGIGSQESKAHFDDIDQHFSSFMSEMRKFPEKTQIFITADHGMIDCPRERTLLLQDHSPLESSLVLPLCGESRACFCYVRPSKVPQFETYVKETLASTCTLFTAEDMVAQEYFGLFSPHHRLLDRVGDYVLAMKDNFVLRDETLGENREWLVGHHGGLSEEEMFVPLITSSST